MRLQLGHMFGNRLTSQAADVAAYLEWHLRTGGIDGQGQTLPPRLVEDIKSWVFRAQVNGRIFLKGSEEEWS